jgi:hypothetical protein
MNINFNYLEGIDDTTTPSSTLESPTSTPATISSAISNAVIPTTTPPPPPVKLGSNYIQTLNSQINNPSYSSSIANMINNSFNETDNKLKHDNTALLNMLLTNMIAIRDNIQSISKDDIIQLLQSLQIQIPKILNSLQNQPTIPAVVVSS